MATLSDIVSALDEKLQPSRFPNDPSRNGLQVANSGEVHKVRCGVDGSLEFFERAAAEGADLCIVHHGISWGDSLTRISGLNYELVSFLVKHNMALYACHLPLDAHLHVGNNAQIYEMLNLEPSISLCRKNGYCPNSFMEGIGYMGHGIITDDMLKTVFPNGYQAFNFESGKEYKVAICSGSGTSGLQEAYDLGCNMFITGEIRESTPIFAAEHNMAVIAAGHHRSEIFGVLAIADYLRTECKLDAKFVNIDNPI